jgi:hypothetical protein
MCDLQVLAYQADQTRVITFQMAQEGNNRSYPEIGIPDQHHPLTHHRYEPTKVAKVEKTTQNLPIMLVGGADGQIKGGRHIRYPKDTPLTNLYLTMLDKLKVPMENLGDSTGKLALLPIA